MTSGWLVLCGHASGFRVHGNAARPSHLHASGSPAACQVQTCGHCHYLENWPSARSHEVSLWYPVSGTVEFKEVEVRQIQ